VFIAVLHVPLICWNIVILALFWNSWGWASPDSHLCSVRHLIRTRGCDETEPPFFQNDLVQVPNRRLNIKFLCGIYESWHHLDGGRSRLFRENNVISLLPYPAIVCRIFDFTKTGVTCHSGSLVPACLELRIEYHTSLCKRARGCCIFSVSDMYKLNETESAIFM
jgi:hypothetical protein